MQQVKTLNDFMQSKYNCIYITKVYKYKLKKPYYKVVMFNGMTFAYNKHGRKNILEYFEEECLRYQYCKLIHKNKIKYLKKELIIKNDTNYFDSDNLHKIKSKYEDQFNNIKSYNTKKQSILKLTKLSNELDIKIKKYSDFYTFLMQQSSYYSTPTKKKLKKRKMIAFSIQGNSIFQNNNIIKTHTSNSIVNIDSLLKKTDALKKQKILHKKCITS